MSQLVIGLTGGIGSGKTAVSDLFQQKKIDIIDADVIAREVVEPGQPALKAIADHFGKDILLQNGALDRPKMREIAFANNENKEWLNALLHPLIRARMQSQTASAKSPYCILSVPLLVENKMSSMVSRVLVVDIDQSLQIQRASKRDQQTSQQLAKIVAAQASREERLAVADDVIDNSGDLPKLKKQVDALHISYVELANNLSKGLKSH
jgi:dephospho-CoA kinase